MVNHPNRSKAPKEPYAVLYDGEDMEFRVYDAENNMGDLDHLEDTIKIPHQHKSADTARKWFDQTLYGRSLKSYTHI